LESIDPRRDVEKKKAPSGEERAMSLGGGARRIREPSSSPRSKSPGYSGREGNAAVAYQGVKKGVSRSGRDRLERVLTDLVINVRALPPHERGKSWRLHGKARHDVSEGEALLNTAGEPRNFIKRIKKKVPFGSDTLFLENLDSTPRKDADKTSRCS